MSVLERFLSCQTFNDAVKLLSELSELVPGSLQQELDALAPGWRLKSRDSLRRTLDRRVAKTQELNQQERKNRLKASDVPEVTREKLLRWIADRSQPGA